MDIYDGLISLRLNKKLIEILLTLCVLNWFVSYTVFCYFYFSYNILNIHTIITQLTSIPIFIWLYYHSRKVSNYIEYLLDPHSSFSQETHHDLCSKYNIYMMFIVVIITYTIVTQYHIAISLF